MLRVAVAQLNSVNDLDANLRKLRALFEDAVQQKAEAIAFPEMAYFMGKPAEWEPLVPRYTEVLGRFQQWAREARVWLLPGSLREPIAGSARKYYNTLPVIDPTGRVVGGYRKLFLFRATLPDRSYDETEFCAAGDTVVTHRIEGLTAGLAICFDLRFPELFRALRLRGAQLLFLPAAFTATTGAAHWESLLRARAIENQCFVAAPAQVGRTGEGGETFGHSAIYSPWGEPLGVLRAGEGVVVAEIDPEEIRRCREKVDAWACRREELFPFG